MKRYHVSINILPNNIETQTSNGVRIEKRSDGTLRLNGKALATFNIKFSSIAFTEGKAYTLSGVTGFTADALQIYTQSNTAFPRGNRLACADGAVTRTAEATETCNVNLYMYEGATYNNVIVSPMIIEGTDTSAAYDPYTTDIWHDIPCRRYGTATDTLTTLPADLYADGNSATVGLVGNMAQTGTPSPSSPIQPQECGDKTANLFDLSNPLSFNGYYNTNTNALNANPQNAFVYIPITQGMTYYVRNVKRYNTSVTVRWLTTSSAPADSVSSVRTGVLNQSEVFTFTAQSNENYFLLFVCGDSDYNAYGSIANAIENNCNELIIDNGYKIPISSASTTTPVYLGEVQSTRQIKKLVLDGTETGWTKSSRYQGSFFAQVLTNINIEAHTEPVQYALCSHAQFVNLDYFANGTASITGNTTQKSINLWIGESEWTVDEFKSYLATQYAAGTPVTVWYVLANETTGIVNEPLRKIDDYADTVSGITIPTITGKDTFDVQTTLKPSEVSLAYTGWHDASAKEWDGSQWV